jgi:hypothetical protein
MTGFDNCNAKIEYNWDCPGYIDFKCEVQPMRGVEFEKDCSKYFKDESLFMMYTYQTENWAMNNNHMKLFDHFYYKYTYPQDLNCQFSSQEFKCDWFFCDGTAWDGFSSTTDGCWLEKCENQCGDKVCKEWHESWD